MKMLIRACWLLFLTATAVFAQSGDKPGEVQKPLVLKKLIPPAPFLSPEQALKSFKLQPGFRIELVAAEPLIHKPIVMSFDADGRLWVLEMRAFMPNADGDGEFEKIGSIAVLEDTNGDGRMDKRTEFINGLVMPRAMLVLKDGVVVAEPPNLWFFKDTDGDGKADQKTQIAKDYATQADPKLEKKANIEHSSNSPTWALDNWIYSANHTTRFRLVDGEWKREPTAFRGQWGLSQDDFGRLVYNSNSDQLRMDLVPSQYLTRNPFFRTTTGLNIDPVKNQKTWPARVNPGINRGYQPQMLREGKLAVFTAACGPVVYRGDNFPAEYRGNVFVCEPAGNLIKRNIVVDEGGALTGRHAYENSEFLASTDERFRPVNAFNGPDGGLYLVDMYHGIIQHRIYVTSYLRQQAEDRGLEKGTDSGRIYRVVYGEKKTATKPNMSKASPPELVGHLSHANGWWRDTAQRLLVENSFGSAIAPLKELVTTGKEPMGRLHALWTLDGMGQLDAGTLGTVLKSEQHSKIRAMAIRLTEPFIKTDPKSDLLPKVLEQAKVNHADVQLQLAFTLGEVKDPQAEKAMAGIARNRGDNIYIRDAILSGLGLRELEFLQQILADKSWDEKKPAREQFLSAIAKCVFTHGKGDRVARLLELAAKASAWQQAALLDGMGSAGVPIATKRKSAPAPVPPKLIRMASQPAALATLSKSPNASKLAKFSDRLVWPGKPGVKPEPPLRPLTAVEQARFDNGRVLYETTCAACHQPHGFGQDGLAPPLVDSEWVLGSQQRLVRIILHGALGPMTVKGQKVDLEMPGLRDTFDDEQIASILTYIRREWEHTADPIAPASVKSIREATAKRGAGWSQEELLKLK
jgi:mono/diheme cytochrome c family protein/glucose/arabinose dehydrogenase